MELVLYTGPFSARFTTTRDRRADGSTGVTLTTFTCFGMLPAELRVRVWKLTYPGPRIIQLYRRYDDPRDKSGGFKFSAWTPLPIALHVNAESRTEALRTYTLCFGNDHAGLKKPAAIPFDFEIDILDLTQSEGTRPAEYIASEDAQRIKFLVLCLYYVGSDHFNLKFNNLKLLRLTAAEVFPDPVGQGMAFATGILGRLQSEIDDDHTLKYNYKLDEQAIEALRSIDTASMKRPAAGEMVPWNWAEVFVSEQ